MKKISILLLMGVLLWRCDFGDFGDINKNPNLPSQYDTRYFYIYAVRSVTSFYLTGTYDPWNQIYPQYFSEKTNIQFTKFELAPYAIGSFYTGAINNLNLIIRLNTDEATKNDDSYVLDFSRSNANQIALARTLRAYIFMHLTDALGMIPYSEAFKALEGNYKPKYDDQEFIYTDLDKELREAYAQFDESAPFNETIEHIYKGDVKKWKKFNASVRMMLAIKLAKNSPNEGKARFSAAYNDGFIRANSEIFQYNYLNETANQNPLYNNIVVEGRADFFPSGTLIDTLLAYNDPRVEAYAEANKYGTYYGVPFGLDKETAGRISFDTISRFHPKYYKQNSPAVLVTPSVMLLAAAEAAELGWISADPAALYKEAITASFAQHDIDLSEVDPYYDQSIIKYEGTQEQKLFKIAMQKWLAAYLQDGFEAYSNWRRTGVPGIKPGPNATVTHIPYRRTYDPGEKHGQSRVL